MLEFASKPLKGIRFIDLFCGIGGFRYALESLGGKCVFSSEIDKAAIETYKANHGEEPAGDIKKILAADIPDHDILCGGYPCQPFSIAGSREGFKNEEKGTLFHEIIRITKVKQPRFLLLENVKGLLNHDGGRTFSQCCSLLQNIGYQPYSELLNASNFNVPHARERVLIVASKNLNGFNFPAGNPATFPALPPRYLRDVLLPGAETAKYVIQPSKIRDGPFVTIAAPPPECRPIRCGYVNKGRQGERIYHPNGHAVTLSSGGGGPGAKTGLYWVNGKVRRLAPRECARLMGLPESFVLNKSDTQTYRQMGNGVVVDVVQAVAARIGEAF